MSASGHRKHDYASVCQPSFVTRTKKGPHVGIDKMRLMVSPNNKITSNKCASFFFAFESPLRLRWVWSPTYPILPG